MPSQMLAMVTDTSECSELSHQTESTPTPPSSRLITPESASNIHCQVVADTMMGSSHGTRKRARRNGESGKERWKKTASARPIVYWNSRETRTKNAVWPSVGQNCGEPMTSR